MIYTHSLSFDNSLLYLLQVHILYVPDDLTKLESAYKDTLDVINQKQDEYTKRLAQMYVTIFKSMKMQEISYTVGKLDKLLFLTESLSKCFRVQYSLGILATSIPKVMGKNEFRHCLY